MAKQHGSGNIFYVEMCCAKVVCAQLSGVYALS